MTDRILIEPREWTPEPLVEISLVGDDHHPGPFVPAGRRFHQYEDGSDSYARTDDERVAFEIAEARVANTGVVDRVVDETQFVRMEESEEMVKAGLDSNSDRTQRSAFIVEYRKTHPLPTSLAELPAGHPSNNYAVVAPAIAATAQPDPANASAGAAPAPSAAKTGTTVEIEGDPSAFEKPFTISVAGVAGSHVVAPTETHVAVEKTDVTYLRRLTETLKRDALDIAEHFAMKELDVLVGKLEARV